MNKYIKENLFKIFNVWLFFIIISFIILLRITTSNACPEDKVTWILLTTLIFIFSYKFYIESLK